MDSVISLLVLSALPQLVVPETFLVTSFRAVVEIVSGDSKIFSGESVRLKCRIPDTYRSTWTYRWFKGSQELPQVEEHLTLWRATVKDSGKFYCEGVRDTVVGNIRSLQSLPVEINVDGGWAILQVPPHPSLVGDTLMVTCRVRNEPQLQEVILYKDGAEVMRQKGLNPHLYLTNVTLEDQGMYSCRASWDADRRTRSVISTDTPVQILEVLSQPILEIVADDNLISLNWMKLVCHVQYNAPAPVPPIHYYFYKNNNRLGTATSENHDLVRQTPGQYSCKAKVPELGLSRWSESKSFGEGTAEPTAVQSFPQQSTAAPTFIQPDDVSNQSPDPLLKTPHPQLSTAQTLSQTTLEVGSTYEESGDMSSDGVL